MRRFVRGKDRKRDDVALRKPSKVAKPKHKLHPMLHLQQTVGNQAVQRMLLSNRQRSNASLLATEASHFGPDFTKAPRPYGNMAIMRKVSLPSAEELDSEIAKLQSRYAALVEEEAKEGWSLRETGRVGKMLAWREGLVDEKDPIRKRIIFCRGRIHELFDEFPGEASSKRREEIKREIRTYEIELARALEGNISRLDTKISDLHDIPLTERVMDEIYALEKERVEDKAELDILKRIVTTEKAEAIAKRHAGKPIIKATKGGCMAAAYTGLDEFLPKGEVKSILRLKLKSIDAVWETLEAKSRAGEKIVAEYKYKSDKKAKRRVKGKWVTSPEKIVLDTIKPEFLGWYFFGLAVAGGYHSVILAVDNSEGDAPKIYWMDQHKKGKGFSKEVTGMLDEELEDYHLDPDPATGGWAKTRIWPLIPAPETVIELP